MTVETIRAGLGVAAGVVSVADAAPYIRDVMRRRTIPHRGSWTIWAVLATVALGAQFAQGMSWSIILLLIQAVGTAMIAALSYRFGTGGLTTVERFMFAVAMVGAVGWWFTDHPFVATAGAIAADLIGALMLIPKIRCDPFSETVSTFWLGGLAGALACGALSSTAVDVWAYPVYFALANLGLAALISRRRSIQATVAA